MNFLLLLALALVVYLKMTGKIKISWWWVVGGVALYIAWKADFLSLFGAGGPNTDNPAEIDECGCGPGQNISMSRRNIWGNYKNAGQVPCQTALARVADNGRWRINGCVN